MSKAKSLAERFAAAEQAVAEATRELDRVRDEYFADRRQRARAGEDLPPLVALDSESWQRQLNSEAVARRNGEQDRLAGLAA